MTTKTSTYSTDLETENQRDNEDQTNLERDDDQQSPF